MQFPAALAKPILELVQHATMPLAELQNGLVAYLPSGLPKDQARSSASSCLCGFGSEFQLCKSVGQKYRSGKVLEGSSFLN